MLVDRSMRPHLSPFNKEKRIPILTGDSLENPAGTGKPSVLFPIVVPQFQGPLSTAMSLNKP
jgi:hypothetical protein